MRDITHDRTSHTEATDILRPRELWALLAVTGAAATLGFLVGLVGDSLALAAGLAVAAPVAVGFVGLVVVTFRHSDRSVGTARRARLACRVAVRWLIDFFP